MSEELGEFIEQATWEAIQKSHPRLAVVIQQLVETGQTPTQIAARVRESGLVANSVYSAAAYLARQKPAA